MNRKRFVIILLSIGFFSLFLIYFINWLSEDDTAPVKLPIKSKVGSVTITSNGCCLWAENVVVSLIDKNGDKTKLSETKKVYEDDIFNYKIPDSDLSQFSVLLELSVFYSDECKFSKKVLKFNNIQELKEKGLLIYIQEADGPYINVISGKNHVSYKLSDNKPYIWIKEDKPHKVYSLD